MIKVLCGGICIAVLHCSHLNVALGDGQESSFF